MMSAFRLLPLLAVAAVACPAAAQPFSSRLDRLEAEMAQAGRALGLPVVPVQWGAPPPDSDAAVRLNRLEGQMRQLNGSIEQMQNQVRVLTEQLRRFQQDTEFRFQSCSRRAARSSRSAAAKRRPPRPRPEPRPSARSRASRSRPPHRRPAAR